MRRINPFFKSIGILIIAIITLISFFSENKILLVIDVSILSLILATSIFISLHLILRDFISQISNITSWSYERDNNYFGYSISANRKLLGIKWSTKEYIAGSEEEALKFISLRN